MKSTAKIRFTSSYLNFGSQMKWTIYIYIYIWSGSNENANNLRVYENDIYLKKIREPTKITHDFALNFGKGHANDFDCKLQILANHVLFCT